MTKLLAACCIIIIFKNKYDTHFWDAHNNVILHCVHPIEDAHHNVIFDVCIMCASLLKMLYTTMQFWKRNVHDTYF